MHPNAVVFDIIGQYTNRTRFADSNLSYLAVAQFAVPVCLHDAVLIAAARGICMHKAVVANLVAVAGSGYTANVGPTASIRTVLYDKFSRIYFLCRTPLQFPAL